MTSILLIYTGGTIGMMEDHESGALIPFDFQHLADQVPELKRFDVSLSAEAFDEVVDSSDIKIDHWQRIARLIYKRYDEFDGFVILHGTDTMAYTASALSFMLPNITKPVVITGSQLPIGMIRTDGKENLISSIQLATLKQQGRAVVQEVAIYFGSELYRGNRTYKYSTEDFEAFKSPNHPKLAAAGIHIFFDHNALYKPSGAFELKDQMNEHVAVMRIVPGLRPEMVKAILEIPDLRGLIIESFGSGNAMTDRWFLDLLREGVKNGLNIVNVTQCDRGFVEQGRYETSHELNKMGVIPGGDMTFEAAYTKLMHVLAYSNDRDELARKMVEPLAGEMTSYSTLV